jgi:hypothetical protein
VLQHCCCCYAAAAASLLCLAVHGRGEAAQGYNTAAAAVSVLLLLPLGCFALPLTSVVRQFEATSLLRILLLLGVLQLWCNAVLKGLTGGSVICRTCYTAEAVIVATAAIFTCQSGASLCSYAW